MLKEECRLYWNAWPLDRLLILFVGAAFILIGIQVTMFHYRQNFHHKSMWTPVVSAPVFAASALVLSAYNAGWLRGLFGIFMVVGVVNGLIGVYLHARGVRVRVGGWAIRNFLIGPPVVLPFLFTAISGLGIIALYWR
ncbi:hypothetical protein DLM86_24940 [Paenibacillus flagellatus]|uniref:Uncharacterized protein n=1 Tax=Paenibacillus flagellatus TaxID=2211139 RepID=A0A2V5KBL8_9BACL|nr:hypothetical protein DLM86_24940 [Paenibacillus flagellatus]